MLTGNTTRVCLLNYVLSLTGILLTNIIMP